jgi:hypothetical protein
MTPRHYLYPLNPRSGYAFQDDRGNWYPTSVEGFLDCFANLAAAEWGIHHGINTLKKGDYIWVHFALPVSAIMAVGRVRDVPHFNKKLDQHTIWIDWDSKLTKRLQRQPIPFSAHRQVAPVSVREANATTRKVINKWLAGSRIRGATSTPAPVRSTKGVIEQRQGQSVFRQHLMMAYEYQCAVTRCKVRDALQAAHIDPVSATGQHLMQNGLLLRADIHNLFDRGLLTIDDNYKVCLHPSIRTSVTYRSLHGKRLAVIPKNLAHRPGRKHLAKHRKNHSSTRQGSGH